MNDGPESLEGYSVPAWDRASRGTRILTKILHVLAVQITQANLFSSISARSVREHLSRETKSRRVEVGNGGFFLADPPAPQPLANAHANGVKIERRKKEGKQRCRKAVARQSRGKTTWEVVHRVRPTLRRSSPSFSRSSIDPPESLSWNVTDSHSIAFPLIVSLNPTAHVRQSSITLPHRPYRSIRLPDAGCRCCCGCCCCPGADP